jgi:hypothetical protein
LALEGYVISIIPNWSYAWINSRLKARATALEAICLAKQHSDTILIKTTTVGATSANQLKYLSTSYLNGTSNLLPKDIRL